MGGRFALVAHRGGVLAVDWPPFHRQVVAQGLAAAPAAVPLLLPETLSVEAAWGAWFIDHDEVLLPAGLELLAVAPQTFALTAAPRALHALAGAGLARACIQAAHACRNEPSRLLPAVTRAALDCLGAGLDPEAVDHFLRRSDAADLLQPPCLGVQPLHADLLASLSRPAAARS